MNKIMVVIKKYWPEIVTAAAWAWTQFGPVVTTYIVAHPHIAMDVSTVAVFLARMAGSSLKGE